MGVTEGLKKDHQGLRRKLEFLEAAMQVAPEAQFALREMCFSLAKRLDAHIKREEQVLAPYHNRIRALTQDRLAQDHADQRVVLRDVNALLLGGIKAPVSMVVPLLAHLIEELQEHMDEEEREIFPMVDRMTGDNPKPPTPAAQVPLITETMTVNHVLTVHPRAREIFEAFKVDVSVDGIHCLEELYWRRGIDVAALLQTLKRAGSESVVAR